MLKNLIMFFLLLVNSSISFTQNEAAFRMNEQDVILFWKADSLFTIGEYTNALDYYKSVEPEYYFNRSWPVKKALCYFINNDTLEAQAYFETYVLNGGHFVDSKNISGIPLIEKIAPNKEVLDRFIDNTIKFESSDSSCLYPNVREQLGLMRIEDQRYRNGEGGDGNLTSSDSINQLKLNLLINEHGWLGYKQVGISGENASFLIVQHADLNVDFQQKCLILLKNELYNYNISSQSFAMLYDRIKVNTGEAQLFGTQVVKDSITKNIVTKRLVSKELVNPYRLYFGLNSIEDYLEFMVWKGMKN